MNNTDLIIFLIVIVIITVIIVLNINRILDNKLNNVAVNIPPINIPSPQITVKIQKSCGDNDNFSVFVDKNNPGQTQQTVTLSPSQNEHFGNLPNVNLSDVSNIKTNLENNFKDVLNTTNKINDKINDTIKNTIDTVLKKPANDINNKNVLGESSLLSVSQILPKIQNINVISNYDDIKKTSMADIPYPDDDNIVPYGNYPYIKKMEQNQETNKAKKTICGNTSLNDMRINAYGKMTRNSKYINDIKFPICDNTERNLIGDNINDEDIDITEIYRDQQVFVKTYLEDPIVRAYNLDTYESYSPLFKSGNIPLDNEFKNPKPSGFIFTNNPAYER